jgi:hypothetical protein
VIDHSGGAPDCDSEVVAQNAVAINSDYLTEREIIFTGTVYDGQRETRTSFPVLVSLPRMTESSTAGPLKLQFRPAEGRFPQV